MIDKKAKDILFKTYWSSAGWKNDQNQLTSTVDFEYAKSKGLMFEKLTITKPELYARLKEIVSSISQKKVTDAFLCSLTNKRLDWRSGLASLANAQRLLVNDNVPDFYFGHGTDVDLNILNFERIKWSGVRHSHGIYNWLDLTLLEKETIPNPTQQDLDLFKTILAAIDESPVDETSSKLRERLKNVFNRAKAERHMFLEILGCAGILRPLRFDRKEPGKHDWTFVLHWRGEDKYDRESVRKYFGEYGIH